MNNKKPKYKRNTDTSSKQKQIGSSQSTRRLNQYIAQAGICSRRQADELIKGGLIKVNDLVVKEMGFRVNNQDKVIYKGQILKAERLVYVLLNKPRDYITTVHDEQNRKIVLDLVKNHFKECLYPVGRLDRHTTGLLLLTNDGEITRQLNHPSSEVQKIYRVTLDKPLQRQDFDKIKERQFELEDGDIPFDGINMVDNTRAVIDIDLHSGKNRIIRRVFEHIGYEVIRLDRIAYANLTKKRLQRGKWRELNSFEVIKLKHLNKK